MKSERELVKATLHGEVSAFEELVRALRYPMVSSAFHMTGNAEDAQDLAQEALVEGYRQLHTLRDGSKLRGWLFAILRNKCLRHLERRRHGAISLEECGELPAPPPQPDDAQLLECLNRLPWVDREILAARYLQDLPYTEVAGALGISVHAARVRCSRARERLRALMLQAEEEQTRRTLQRVMGTVVLGDISDHFVHRVIQEVTPIMHTLHENILSGGHPGKAMLAGLHAAGGKIAVGVVVALLLTGAGVLRYNAPRREGGNSIATSYGAAISTARTGKGAAATDYTLAARWQLTGKGEQYSVAPFDVAVDNNGHVFIIDYGHSDGSNSSPRLRKFDSRGHFLAESGNGGKEAGLFKYPCGIDVDDAGNVYVADQGNNRVQQFDNNGFFLMQFAPRPGMPGYLSSAASTVIEPDGNLYVCAMGACTINKFSADGKFLLSWGGEGKSDGQFIAPNAIGRDPAGNIFVLDVTRCDVQKFTADGQFLAKWPISNPWGMAVDSVGNIYVGSRTNNIVMKYTNDGKLITNIPVNKTRDAIGGITVDKQGYVYILCWKELLIYRPR